MAKQIEKDRYIHLDGTPVEYKGLWRHVSPLCLAVTFSTAALCSNYYDSFPHKDKDTTPIVPIVDVSIGLLFARGMRELLKYSFSYIPFNRTAYDKYVIDTKKSTPEKAINPLEETLIKKQLLATAYAQGAFQGILVFGHGIADGMFSAPMLYDCITHAHRHYKLKKGDWVIIDRNDMKKVEQEQKQEKHSHALAPAV